MSGVFMLSFSGNLLCSPAWCSQPTCLKLSTLIPPLLTKSIGCAPPHSAELYFFFLHLSFFKSFPFRILCVCVLYLHQPHLRSRSFISSNYYCYRNIYIDTDKYNDLEELNWIRPNSLFSEGQCSLYWKVLCKMQDAREESNL